MTLDFDTCYRALAARDARFDGRFFTGVTSTGIYCRPICPARTPRRANIRFFSHAGAAEAAGFRACRRCRPEASPGSPDWDVRADLAARALRLISDGFVDEHGVAGLAHRLAVTDRHLRRLLLAELGATPLALARTTRLQTARRLLAETALPVSDVAFASGFASIRQFNDSIREAFGVAPSALRDRRPAARAGDAGDWITLRLACRRPFDSSALLAFLAERAVPGVETVTGQTYARTVSTPGGPAVVQLSLPADEPAPGDPGSGTVMLRARLPGLRGVGQVVSRCRHLLDLNADPAAIAGVLRAEPALAPLVGQRPGLRVPGAYDGFELAVRAVLGQQVSVRAARTFAARLAARYGTPLAPAGDSPAREPAANSELPDPADTPVTAAGAAALPGTLFPSPTDLAEADLSGLGLTTARQATLRALAGACASGAITLDPGADPEETAAALSDIPGIGDWTVQYVLMRALHHPDAFPGTDLGVRRALERLGMPQASAHRWRPWRAYAVMHLWTADHHTEQE